METTKDRLLLFLKESGISQRKFELTIGVSNGYINNLKSSPSSKVMQSIFSKYPRLSTTWLLAGEGCMLNETEEIDGEVEDGCSVAKMVFRLPISAQGGSLNDFVAQIKKTDCEQIISPISGAEFAIPVCGESMAPEYPNGSVVFIKKINDAAFIDWGGVFVLDTCNGTILKKVFPGTKDNSILCKSINPDFNSYEIEKKHIFGIYKVLMCMSLK